MEHAIQQQDHYICVVAGKSGGHIVPGLELARLYMKEHQARLIFFSANTSLDRSIVESSNLVSRYVPLSFEMPLGYNPLSWMRSFIQGISSTTRSFYYLLKTMPKKIISMGGHVSLPVCLSGWLLRIPIELYELNAVPGKAVRWLAPLGSRIHVVFRQALGYFDSQKVLLSSYPVRFSSFDRKTKHEACALLGIEDDKKVILVLGGSQGSQSINDVIMDAIRSRSELNQNVQWIHQTGKADIDRLKEFYKKNAPSALVFDYRNDLNVCYSAADLVIARAGAGTLFETLFFNKPAIIVPLKTSTTDHQVDNARAMVHEYPNLFMLVDQDDLRAKMDTL